MTHRSLGSYLQEVVKKHPDVLALHIRRGLRVEKYTYREMLGISLKFSRLLKEKSVRKGEKVLVWGPNMPEWVFALLGCLFSGIVVVPVSMHASTETAEKYRQQTNAKILIKSRVVQIAHPEGVEVIEMEKIPVLTADMRPLQPAVVRSDDLAEILYTSGTTGDPAGVMLSHRNILHGLTGLQQLIPPADEYRLLSILPLSHALEQFVGLFTVLNFGATIFYLTRVNPVVIARALRTYRITHMITVPQLLKAMWDTIEFKAEAEGKLKLLRVMLSVSGILPFWARRLMFRQIHSSLGGRLCMFGCAGAPLDTYIAKNWEKIGVVVIEGYGTTETSAGVAANTLKHRCLGSVGRIMDGVDMKFTDEGEILTRGPNLSRGYFKNPKKTREMFTADGYFKTGDVGYIGRGGYVFLSGRKKFKIVTASGEKVYPEDLERVLNEHRSVHESCVIGIDRGSGEVIHAVLCLKKKGHAAFGPEAQEEHARTVITEINERLESHQKILEYSVWEDDDFPRTRTLKKDRHTIKMRILQKEGLTEGSGPSEYHEVGLESRTGGDRVAAILSSVCDVDPAGIQDEQSLVLDLKTDSLRRVMLVSMIEDELGVEVLEEEISEKTTVGDLRRLIERGKKVTEVQSHIAWPLSRGVVLLREFLRQVTLFPLVRAISPKLEVRGESVLRELSAPSIVIFNHVGHNEPSFILKVLPKNIRMKQVSLADPRGYSNRLIAWLRYLYGAAFPLQKFGGPIRHSLELAVDLLDGGWVLLLSPEGIRSADGNLQEFKGGVSALAVETGVPVYPVKVKGYHDVYPVAGKHIDIPRRRGVVTLVFGEPLVFAPGTPYEQATAEMRRVLGEM